MLRRVAALGSRGRPRATRRLLLPRIRARDPQEALAVLRNAYDSGRRVPICSEKNEHPVMDSAPTTEPRRGPRMERSTKTHAAPSSPVNKGARPTGSARRVAEPVRRGTTRPHTSRRRVPVLDSTSTTEAAPRLPAGAAITSHAARGASAGPGFGIKLPRRTSGASAAGRGAERSEARCTVGCNACVRPRGDLVGRLRHDSVAHLAELCCDVPLGGIVRRRGNPTQVTRERNRIWARVDYKSRFRPTRPINNPSSNRTLSRATGLLAPRV